MTNVRQHIPIDVKEAQIMLCSFLAISLHTILGFGFMHPEINPREGGWQAKVVLHRTTIGA